MLDVGRESVAVRVLPEVKAMHDATEGGVLGAVAEICSNAKLGSLLYEEKMPVDALTKRLCADYGVDPLRLLSSGSMISRLILPSFVARSTKSESRLPK
ncbi:MAG: AIR synthase-related protein [Christensenellales bacterium]